MARHINEIRDEMAEAIDRIRENYTKLALLRQHPEAFDEIEQFTNQLWDRLAMSDRLGMTFHHTSDFAAHPNRNGKTHCHPGSPTVG